MSKKTLTQLVSAMRGKSWTYLWDAIALYDQRKANELLFQLFIERFNSDVGYFEPADLLASWGDGSYKEHGFGLKFGVPRLSFVNADPENEEAKARLTMDFIGGVLMSTKENTGGTIFVSRILKMLPVGGPQLWMDQPVTKGKVGGLGEVVIDISKANRFMANFVFGTLAQTEVGARFQEYFETKVKPEQKVFPLGTLKGDLNGPMTPKSFEVKTMRSDPLAALGDENYGDGAVIVFTTLRDGKDSIEYPNKNSPYMIPSDEQGTKYTGGFLLSNSVLLDRLTREHFIKSMAQWGIDFYPLPVTPDIATTLVANAGGIGFRHDTRYHFWYPPIKGNPGYWQDMSLDGDVHFSFKDRLSVSVDYTDNSLRLQMDISEAFVYRLKGLPEPHCRVNLRLIVDTKSTLALGAEGKLKFDSVYSNSDVEVGAIEWLQVTPPSPYNTDDMRQEFNGYLDQLKRVVNGLGFSEIDTFLALNILFPGENALQPTAAFMPGDIYLPCVVDPVRTSMVLAPLNSTIEAGSNLSFSLTPTPDDVVWSVKDVDGNIAQPGSISPTGIYTAPAVDALPDGAVVVMVTAEGTLDGKPVKSSALVSVLYSTIIANPLYSSCDSGKTLTLSAESLGSTPLQWNILTPQWGSTLSIDDENPNNRIYTAGTNLGTETPYPIDIIELKNPETQATSQITLLIEKQLIIAAMVLAEGTDLPNGKACFQLLGSDGPLDPEKVKISWEKLVGNGHFDEVSGLYTEPDSISPGEFVVLLGVADVAGVVKIYGQIAVPLPLKAYAEIIEKVDLTIRSA